MTRSHRAALRRLLRAGAAGATIALAACSGGSTLPGASVPVMTPLGARDIILATTTSTQDSGLLDVLVPAFEEVTGYSVKTVAVGSGQALAMGEEGNADVLLVHSPAAERAFMATGAGLDRQLVMHNSFLVVGPPSDPAGTGGATSVVDAFTRIAATRATFVSRGDGSGTEAKELGYWQAAGVSAPGSSYLQSGQGMAGTLRIASEKAAYTLVDIATWAAIRAQVDLVPLVTDDPSLLNPYHVIRVDPASWPRVNADGAAAFAAYLLSPEGQALIGAFGPSAHGIQLFVPDAGKTERELGAP